MGAKSPCTDICRFDAATGWCEGCGRTRDETVQWRKLTPFRRGAVERELPRRMRQLSGRTAVVTSSDGSSD